jgi:predicted metal-binding protein
MNEHDECYACPVGGMFAKLDAVQPDALEHLLTAAHELLQAARAVIDAADGVVEQQRRARELREPRVRRIDVL